MILPFSPGPTSTLGVTAASGRVALATPRGAQIRVVSAPGGQTAFIKFGDSTVTAAVTDMPILPGAIETFTVPLATPQALFTHVAAITASSTATLYFTSGDGQ